MAVRLGQSSHRQPWKNQLYYSLIVLGYGSDAPGLVFSRYSPLIGRRLAYFSRLLGGHFGFHKPVITSGASGDPSQSSLNRILCRNGHIFCVGAFRREWKSKWSFHNTRGLPGRCNEVPEMEIEFPVELVEFENSTSVVNFWDSRNDMTACCISYSVISVYVTQSAAIPWAAP